MEYLDCNLAENCYNPSSIVKVIKKCFHHKFSSNSNQLKVILGTYYFKLPYISKNHINMKLSKLGNKSVKEKLKLNMFFFISL